MHLQLLLLVIIFTVITLISGKFGIGAPQTVVIYPLSTYKCDDVETLIDIDINLHAKNDDGEKVLDADIDFDFDLTEEWQCVINIDKWNNGDWDKDMYNTNGKACDIFDQFIPKVWKKIGHSIEPNFPQGCGVPKAHYKLKDFEITRNDYDIPATLYGKFRVTGILTDESGTDIWCQVMELQVDRT